MAADTNRPALALGLPWVHGGLVLLTFAIGLPALLSAAAFEELVSRLALRSIAPLVGSLGSAACAVGLWILARARVAGRLSPWLVAGACAWTAELAGRVSKLAGLEGFDAARLALAGLAMYGLCRAIPWLFDRSGPRGTLRAWRLARGSFAVQLAAYALVPLVSYLSGRSLLDLASAWTAGFSFGLSLLWIVFAGPFVLLLVALRRTIGRAAGLCTVEDVLRRVPGRR